MRIEFDEYRLKLEAMKSDLDDLASAIGLSALKEEVEALEAEAAKDGFWDDRDNSQKVLQRTKQVRAKIDRYQALVSRWDDAVTLVQLAIEAEDDEMLEEIISEHDGVAAALEEMRLSTLLSGEYDGLNAILAFHPGAGGTEAQDWAQMLYRMYTRWAERHDFTYQILDFLDGEEAGIKSATILIKGENAYGYLKSEMGVHRLVRVSPFDSSGRRHTSFASLEVMPEFNDTIEINIRDEDLKVDTYR
ncbi:MAG: PCRF domain-containing protein, partial [Clostridia bacterium]|nr:PCRF domain-containing protein [Clostridia bacterium]